MILKDTMRNIQQLYNYKKNFRYALSVAELEPEIDGAVAENMYYFDQKCIDNAFKDFVISKTNFSDDEYSKLFNPVKCINGAEFIENPYLKNINLDNVKVGEITLEKELYKPFEFAIMDEPKQDSSLMRKYTVGVFDRPAFTYVLKNDQFVWMSINPMEVKTAAPAIKKATGSVLVLGGGLAYYPYMISLKEDVSSIHIVETNEDVYEILDKYILPQFPNNKVKLIKSDAYDYINNTEEKYNTVYIDIWQDNVQGFEDYKKFVKFENKFPKARFDYWLEGSLLDSVIVNIYQYFSAKLGTDDYQRYFAAVAPDLWKYMENLNITIDRPDQMNYYLTRDFAKKVLKEMN